jgi:leucyl/phenylalanyl-tRNA--protein transferase
MPTLKRKYFPNPHESSDDGILAVGKVFEEDILLEAYKNGIFPWPSDEDHVYWFCPKDRGILFFKDLQISRSLKKLIRRTELMGIWSWTVSKNTRLVIENCRTVMRKDQQGTWILSEMVDAYTKLAKSGNVLSIEIWNQQEEIAGGIYGVLFPIAGKAGQFGFSAESMFFKESGASKYAFVKLVEHLKNLGLEWMDIQMLTDVTKSLGGRLIPRQKYLNLIGV